MSAPKCELCGSVAPYGDERNIWIGYHAAWYHRAYWRVRSIIEQKRLRSAETPDAQPEHKGDI